MTHTAPPLSQQQARYLQEQVKAAFADAPDHIPVGVTYADGHYALRFFCRGGQEDTQQAMVDFLQKTSAKLFKQALPDSALLIEPIGERTSLYR